MLKAHETPIVTLTPLNSTSSMLRKKSSTQLDREIAEALAETPARGRHVHAVTKKKHVFPGPRGNYLDPPGYPTHNFHVRGRSVGIYTRRPDMSITEAVSTSDDARELFGDIDPEARQEAQDLLDDWENNRPPITSPKVQEWIRTVLADRRGKEYGIQRILKFYPEFATELVDQLAHDERVALDAMLAGNGKRKAEINTLIPDAGRRRYVKWIADQLKGLSLR